MTRIKKYLKRKGFDFRLIEDEYNEIKDADFADWEENVTVEDIIGWAIWDELTRCLPSSTKHGTQREICAELERKFFASKAKC